MGPMIIVVDPQKLRSLPRLPDRMNSFTFRHSSRSLPLEDKRIAMAKESRSSLGRSPPFLLSLAEDLRLPGYPQGSLGARQIASTLAGLAGIDPLLRLKYLRHQNVIRSQDLIERVERRGALEFIASGVDVAPNAISPRIEICRTSGDLELFAYCQLMQTVPTTRRVGRQIRALVYDEGQRRPFLIGSIMLSSGPYTLGCRDRYFHWTGVGRKPIKDWGLANTLDVAVCLALPPYSRLLGGKLIAALGLSGPLSDEFSRRYGNQLLAVITTCATGLHCPIFNRIGLRPGGLYRRIGATLGYTTTFVSQRTLREARKFLPNFVSAPIGEFSESVRPIHILRNALKCCGVSPEPILRSGNVKGVYVGCIDELNLEALRTRAVPQNCRTLSVESICMDWRQRWMIAALKQDQRRTAFLAFDSTSAALSGQSLSV